MTIGPIQLVALGFDQLDRFGGQIIAELQQIRGRDVIRLLDLLFVARDETGELTVLELSDLPDDEQARYGSLLSTLIGLDVVDDRPAPDDIAPEGSVAGLSLEAVRETPALLEPGTAAALLLVEHRWAARLTAAVRDAGGRLLAQGFLTPDARLVMGEALIGAADQETALEVAAAVRGAVVVDALTALAQVELLEDSVVEAVVEDAAALRSAAAADVVRALVTAGVLEEAAALDAIDALLEAGLIDPDVVEAALDDVTAGAVEGPPAGGAGAR